MDYFIEIKLFNCHDLNHRNTTLSIIIFQDKEVSFIELVPFWERNKDFKSSLTKGHCKTIVNELIFIKAF